MGVGKEDGELRAKVVREEDQVRPPMHGWQFYAGGWESDLTLEWSREVSTPCKKVKVKLQGEAKKKYPDLEGSYLPVKAKMNRGRWVLQHASGKQKYLYVHTDYTSSWMISTDIDGIGGSCWIRSASAGSGCPASPANKNNDSFKRTSWLYCAGKGDWHNAEIVITCATHC